MSGYSSFSGGAAPQGTVTVNVNVDMAELDRRRKNANAYNNINDPASGIKLYPFGDNDALHTVLPNELVLAYKGTKATNPQNKRINGFTSLNGIVLMGDMEKEDFMDSLQLVGVSKIIYDAKNPSTPQNGISVGMRGVFQIRYNAALPKTTYPGDYLVMCLPDFGNSTRTFPLFHGLPAQKILPQLKPLDHGSLKQVQYDIARLAYNNDTLKKISLDDPLIMASPSKSGSLTPFLKCVHKHKKAIITQAMRIVEILAKRGDIEIKNKDPHESLGTLLNKTDMNNINEGIYKMAVRIGLFSDDQVPSARGNGVRNHLQEDVFYATMWPHIEESKRALYEPNIKYQTPPKSKVSYVASMQVKKQNNSINEGNTKYYKQASNAYLDKEEAMASYKAALSGRCVGMTLSTTNPNDPNPMVDVLIGKSLVF
jgi:hypothetical protein